VTVEQVVVELPQLVVTIHLWQEVVRSVSSWVEWQSLVESEIRFTTPSSSAQMTSFPFAIYHAAHPTNPGEDETNKRRKAILQTLDSYDAISLELAATAHYLTQNGYKENAWEETRRRKTVKATTERVEKAQRLLAELGL
jgi:hypothetical protein